MVLLDAGLEGNVVGLGPAAQGVEEENRVLVTSTQD
jgi:hypothetical protein